jgi:hypothetical protein
MIFPCPKSTMFFFITSMQQHLGLGLTGSGAFVFAAQQLWSAFIGVTDATLAGCSIGKPIRHRIMAVEAAIENTNNRVASENFAVTDAMARWIMPASV